MGHESIGYELLESLLVPSFFVFEIGPEGIAFDLSHFSNEIDASGYIEPADFHVTEVFDDEGMAYILSELKPNRGWRYGSETVLTPSGERSSVERFRGRLNEVLNNAGVNSAETLAVSEAKTLARSLFG
jgi:hypothetical protein